MYGAHTSQKPSLYCGFDGCMFTFTTGQEHVSHLESGHGFSRSPSANGGFPGQQPDLAGPSAAPSVIFQDPTQEYDVYISYCPDNSSGGAAFTSPFQDPARIAAELSKKFKPWFDGVSCAAPTGDFYEDRAAALQQVKVVLVLLSPEYSYNEQCMIEYQFALHSLKKPVLPVIIRPGKLDSVIDYYMKQDGRVPFKMDKKISSEKEYQNTMGYLLEAVRRMITDVDAVRETSRMNYLSLGTPSAPPLDAAADFAGSAPPPSYNDFLVAEKTQIGETIASGVPRPGDHVISHWQEHSYFTAHVVRFIKETMSFEIRWDDQDESGRFPSIKMVALNKVPAQGEVEVGSTVFFPQGAYCGQEGVRTGGMRYHEGKVTKVKRSDGKLMCEGHHLKGGNDGKWVTYKGYEYKFKCEVNDIRVAANPLNVVTAYKNSN